MNGKHRVVVALAVVVSTCAMAPTAFGAPPNDSFANATTIGPLPFSDSVDLNGSGTEPGEPQACNFQSQSVWYRFAPSAQTAVRAAMSGSDFGVVFNVYRSFAPGLGGLSFAGCVGFGNTVRFTAGPGETYYIQAGSVSAGPAALHLQVEAIPPPPNDAFADATPIAALPFSDTLETAMATTETAEPTSTRCGFVRQSAWYVFTPSETASVTAMANGFFGASIIAYTGSTLAELTPVACPVFGRLIFRAEAGTRYFIQLGGEPTSFGSQFFSLRLAGSPTVGASYWPFDPSSFDSVQFSPGGTFDPDGGPIESYSWDFGDDSTATGCCPTHRFERDGDYTVRLEVLTPDGRRGSGTVHVSVRTHDIGIDYFSAPSQGIVGKTKRLVVKVLSHRYAEDVEVRLLKSNPAVFGGFEQVASLTRRVPFPSDRATAFQFDYTFTAEDAALGRVTFKVIARPAARDALPADNEVVGTATQVRP